MTWSLGPARASTPSGACTASPAAGARGSSRERRARGLRSRSMTWARCSSASLRSASPSWRRRWAWAPCRRPTARPWCTSGASSAGTWASRTASTCATPSKAWRLASRTTWSGRPSACGPAGSPRTCCSSPRCRASARTWPWASATGRASSRPFRTSAACRSSTCGCGHCRAWQPWPACGWSSSASRAPSTRSSAASSSSCARRGARGRSWRTGSRRPSRRRWPR
mmetsp:Transcript_71135/g.230218  ORF Transcript_71135/g.230218 Transcript_71135/m.230218 type:complete len:225 (-) Transcript_71135:237-911(-)